MRIEKDVTPAFGEWTVDGHPQSIQFPESFWADILPVVMADFLRLPWGGPDIGGVLFGRREPGRLTILAFRPLECDHVHGPAFELSEGDETRLRDLLDTAKIDQDLAGLEAVGWYHSKHHWLVLTPQDLKLYDRYFPEPWQIAMVFLRLRSQPCLLGLFSRREDGSIASCHSEFSMREEKPETPSPAAPPPPEAAPEPAPEPAPEAAPVAEEVAPPQTCCAFWGLSEKPFSHPASPYWNHQSEDVLSRLMRAVRVRSGLIVLTGEAGTGKTTLLERLGDYLTRESTEFAFLLDSRLTAQQFYEFLAYDLTLPCPRRSKVAILKALQDLLLEQAGSGRTSALVIDDAHQLDWEVLEEIRMLDNLQHRTGRLLQTILCGLPELDQRLESDELRPLRERVTVRCRLQPLREEETVECIKKRLTDCGMPDETVFTSEVLSAIHARSGGVLRLTGRICDGLLEYCAARGSRVATVEMLDEVRSDVHAPAGGR